MARAHYQENLTDKRGNVLDGASVYVYDQDTTDVISETIYQGDTGVTAEQSNPITADANGLFEIWLDDPLRVDISVVYGGKTSETRTIDVTYVANDGAPGAAGADGLISEVQNEGVAVTDAGVMDFVGDDVTVTSNGTKITVTIDGAVREAIIDAAGDLIVGSAADTAARLAKGTALQYLRTNAGATALEWATLDVIAASLIDAAGDLIVGTADNTAGRLAKGTALQILRVNSGATALEWATNTKTIRIGHTFAIKGTAANGEVPGFYVSLPSGQTASIVLARYATESGTVTAQVRKNGSALADLTALSVSSTDATTDESPDVALADNDYIDLNLSSASTPVDLRFTVFVEYTV